MKIIKIVEEEVNIKYLKCHVYPRYLEDAYVDFNQDEPDEPMMPCITKDENGIYSWNPMIDVDNGKIINWNCGVSASMNYKVCDEGDYELFDENFKIIDGIYSVYVPNVMCPNSNGFGDYIDMTIDSNGFIKNWDRSKLIELFNKLFENYHIK